MRALIASSKMLCLTNDIVIGHIIYIFPLTTLDTVSPNLEYKGSIFGWIFNAFFISLQDGHYYFPVLDREVARIQALCAQSTQDLEDNSLPEEGGCRILLKELTNTCSTFQVLNLDGGGNISLI